LAEDEFQNSENEQNYEDEFFNDAEDIKSHQTSSSSSIDSEASFLQKSKDVNNSNTTKNVDISFYKQVVSKNTAIPLQRRSRSEKINGFATARDQSVFDTIEYISEETIGRAILKPCCRDECLRKKLNPSPLNFEPVFRKVLEARRQLVGNEWKDKLLILKAIIQGNRVLLLTYYYNKKGLFVVFIYYKFLGGVRSRNNTEASEPLLHQRMRVEYQLGHDKSSPSICAAAFCNAYGITNYLRKQLSKEVKNGVFHRSTAKEDIHVNEAVDKQTLKAIKLMLKDSKVKLPRDLAVTLELPNSIAILKVMILINSKTIIL
jgi:hypothetical protein